MCACACVMCARVCVCVCVCVVCLCLCVCVCVCVCVCGVMCVNVGVLVQDAPVLIRPTSLLGTPGDKSKHKTKIPHHYIP